MSPPPATTCDTITTAATTDNTAAVDEIHLPPISTFLLHSSSSSSSYPASNTPLVACSIPSSTSYAAPDGNLRIPLRPSPQYATPSAPDLITYTNRNTNTGATFPAGLPASPATPDYKPTSKEMDDVRIRMSVSYTARPQFITPAPLV